MDFFYQFLPIGSRNLKGVISNPKPHELDNSVKVDEVIVDNSVKVDEVIVDNAVKVDEVIVDNDVDNDVINMEHKFIQTVQHINGWDTIKTNNVKSWRGDLEYHLIINTFILSDLKKTESSLTWIIIVISTFSSTLSLLQLSDTEFDWLEIYIKGTLSGSTICTTLIAAWLKKNNYVERINILDKYLQKVSRLILEFENIISKDANDRISYKEFEEKYKENIVDLIADPPSNSPYEYKKAVYFLTKYYPEIIEMKFPWYVEGTTDMREFGSTITKTYKSLKYNSFLLKIFSLYFCKCKCLYVNNVNQFLKYDKDNKKVNKK